MEFTDELLEKCAEAVHKAYCNYHLLNKGVEYWTKGNYSLLDEPTKQIDRETVKAVFTTIKANPVEKLVRLPDERLEALSDKVRCGIPIDFIEALEVIEYQQLLKEKRQNSLWERIKHWWKWSA